MTVAEFACAEYDRIFISDQDIDELARRGARHYLPTRPEAGQSISQEIVSRLRAGVPTSMVRVGDGEGCCWALTHDSVRAEQFAAFDKVFFGQDGTTLDEAEAVRFSRRVCDAISAADIVGFRSLDRTSEPELSILQRAFGHGWHLPALGLIYARERLINGLRRGEFADKIITTAWIHMALLSHLDAIMSAADGVVVITGRAQLKAEFEKRLGNRLLSFLHIPEQFSCQLVPMSHLKEASHFNSVFPLVLEKLTADLHGVLVLVGAGLCGKIYCNAAKSAGAIAVDLGSAFDVLAGLMTRMDSHKYNINGLKWI